MNVNLGKVSVGGEFKVVIKNKKGEIKNESCWRDNLLLDRYFAKGESTFNSIFARVGTGNTAPTPIDTQVQSPIGGVSASRIYSGSQTVVGDVNTGFTVTTRTVILSFGLGGIVGNVSEFILTDTSSGSYIAFVRSLFKDSNGNPTTITVTGDDELQIWWRLKKKLPGKNDMSIVSSNVTLDGVDTQVTLKPLNPNMYNTWGNYNFASTNGVDVSHMCFLYGTIGTVVSTVASVLDLINAAAGDDMASVTVPCEQKQSRSAFIHSNPSAGVAKYTSSYTAGINPSGAELPMKLITIGYDPDSSDKLYSVLQFSPEFIKGTDKILSVTFSYTVTRV